MRRPGPAALFCPGLEPPGPAAGEEGWAQERRLCSEAEGSRGRWWDRGKPPESGPPAHTEKRQALQPEQPPAAPAARGAAALSQQRPSSWLASPATAVRGHGGGHVAASLHRIWHAEASVTCPPLGWFNFPSGLSTAVAPWCSASSPPARRLPSELGTLVLPVDTNPPCGRVRPPPAPGRASPCAQQTRHDGGEGQP